MTPLMWSQHELAALEAVSRDDETRKLCLRMASLQQSGRLDPLIEQLRDDDDLDDATKALLTELAEDKTFLLAVQEYVRRTATLH